MSQSTTALLTKKTLKERGKARREASAEHSVKRYRLSRITGYMAVVSAALIVFTSGHLLSVLPISYETRAVIHAALLSSVVLALIALAVARSCAKRLETDCRKRGQ